MKNIAFGKSQLSKPTPHTIRIIIDVWCAVAGATIGWMSGTNWIGGKFAEIASSILGLTVLIGQVIKPYFGVRTGTKRVPIEQVKELDEHEKSIS